jgi:hypothetical protein
MKGMSHFSEKSSQDWNVLNEVQNLALKFYDG